jgi:2-oxoglutarate ferredoxin oxidoreductase subunit gamma
MNERLIFSGSGGQGLLTAGKLLAACTMAEGRHVTYFPSYGSEVRGGTANCLMVVSDKPIASPVVEEATALLIMNEASMERFLPMLAPGGLMVLNTSMVEAPAKLKGVDVLGIPATAMATDFGMVQVANVIMLSALCEAKRLVKIETLHAALVKALSGRRAASIPANEKALEAGRSLAAEWKAR